MAARYKVRLKSTGGVVKKETEDWRTLTYTRIVNGVDTATLLLWQDHEMVPYLIKDSILEIWRKDESNGVSWYKDFEGLMRKPEYNWPDKDRTISPTFLGFNELLNRRAIEWPAGSAEAYKADVGETVIKELVDENAGPGATTGAGRLVGGVTSGLSLEADSARGLAWEGDRAYKSLLVTVQEVALACELRFLVKGEGVAGGIQTFKFYIYDTQLGDDRTTVGLTTSGVNGAGNAPVIFAIDRGNMQNLKYIVDSISEITSVLVLGQGEGASRSYVEVVDATAEAESPWNHRETVANANQETTIDGLTSVGTAKLAELQKKTTLTFDPLKNRGTIYGKHYFHGDLVTARAMSTDFNLEVLQTTVKVENGQEDIKHQFGYVS